MINQTIAELVETRFSRATVLDLYGIPFYEHEHQTLAQACKTYGIDAQVLSRALEHDASNADFFSLNKSPIEIIIKYLRHIHQYFIKVRLPFFARIIDSLDASNFAESAELINDLKLIYPLFSQDYISHIYQEEDTLFDYVDLLLNATKSLKNPGQICLQMRKQDIHRFALEHESHEDELHSIGQMLKLVGKPAKSSLRIAVLAAELEVFASQLSDHATIENTILFPKVLRLESEVKWRIDQKAKYC